MGWWWWFCGEGGGGCVTLVMIVIPLKFQKLFYSKFLKFR